MICNSVIIKYREGNYDEALSYYKQLLVCKESGNELEFDIRGYEIAYHLGTSSFRLEDYDLALDMLSTFLREYDVHVPDNAQYDVSLVHMMLADIYCKRGNCVENVDFAFLHYTKYLECKDPKLLNQLRSSKCGGVYPDPDIVKILPSFGQVSFRAEKFLLAGNCFMIAHYSTKSFPVKDNMLLFSFIEEAYIFYTLAKNKENRSLMIQEALSVMEDVEHFEFPMSNEYQARYYGEGGE